MTLSPTFETTLTSIGVLQVIILPKELSATLPTRGMTMVQATLNGHELQTPVEPDGRGSHWFKIDSSLQELIGIASGDRVRIAVKPIKQWPEPDVPADLRDALHIDQQATKLWNNITPMARWDWLRWIASTGRAETRTKRIQVALSKLKAGERRPCCFNRTLCTDPSVSKNGVLLAPLESVS